MAELLVGPIIKKLIEIGFQYLKDQVRWQTGMKEELERLQKNHPHIQAVVDYASSQEMIKDKYPALNTWLWQLRDAIDEADDVMGELEYLKLKKQLIKTKKQRKVRHIMKSINEILVKTVKRALKIDPTLKRLEEVVHKLDEVSAGFTTFLHLVDKSEQEHQEQHLEFYELRETGSLPKNVSIGRDNEKEFVMTWLRKPSNENQTTPYSNISLLSIVGQGGIGKTTLLQQVYNEEMKNEYDENEFDLKMWACVSNDFNKKTVIKGILESATTSERHSSLVTLNVLQQTLKSTVNSKKFLLVLDDIWEEGEEDKEMNKSKWEDVLAPLASGKLGSKILVSTRMESVAVMFSEIIKKEEKLKLEGLNDDECLQLLYNHAFKKREDQTAYPKLWPIAEMIVKKLSGSPLATKVIGGVLSSRLDETHWNRILNYEIGSQKGILDILKLSYASLPKELQSCFSFCCTFPQDYEFDKDDLVQKWIALGFIQSDKTRRETTKDAGERYFDDLVQKSLFDKFQIWDKTYRYKLHDLLHEMLRTFSTQECLSIVGGEEELLSRIPKTIRHLFVKDINPVVFRKVEEFEHLRSFILVYSESHEDLVDILAKVLKILRSIRLIDINFVELEKIPKEIGDLIHLQYLKINCYSELPTQISLPDFWGLPFLKYLFLYNIPGVKGFDYKFQGNDKVRVFPMLQVLHIERLTTLENLFVATEASHECLFPCLTELHLENCPNLQELIALHPKFEKLKIDHVFPSLQVLHIKRLKALKNLFVATEAAYECLFPCVTELRLEDCPNLLELLALSPKIEKLEIDRVFPSLQVLHIKELGALEDWFVAKAAAYECLFPCLTELHLRNCPNLLELPALPPKLEKLEINNIGWKGSNWLQGITNYCSISIQNCPDLISLQGHQKMETTEKCHLILSELIISDPSMLLKVPLTSVTSIHMLRIENNDEVISFSIDVEEWFLKVSSSLRTLIFSSLESLQFLPSSLESLSSLEILYMKYIPLLQLLPNMPASLKILKLHSLKSLLYLPSSLSFSSLEHLNLLRIPLLQVLPDLPPSLRAMQLNRVSNLHCLPACFPCLFSLEKLSLRFSPQLRGLPDLPPSLKSLDILNCHPELMKRYKEVTSSDRHKIAHIPEVHIYNNSMTFISVDRGVCWC